MTLRVLAVLVSHRGSWVVAGPQQFWRVCAEFLLPPVFVSNLYNVRAEAAAFLNAASSDRCGLAADAAGVRRKMAASQQTQSGEDQGHTLKENVVKPT